MGNGNDFIKVVENSLVLKRDLITERLRVSYAKILLK